MEILELTTLLLILASIFSLITCAPSFAKASAAAFPIPEPAPVISTIDQIQNWGLPRLEKNN